MTRAIPQPPGPQCEALTNHRGTKRRCAWTATLLSSDRTQPPRLVCVHHHARAKHGYTTEPTDLTQLNRSLLMTYLTRAEQYRGYCNTQVTRYLERERDAGLAADAARRRLRETIEEFREVRT